MSRVLSICLGQHILEGELCEMQSKDMAKTHCLYLDTNCKFSVIYKFP